ncbi:MAG: MFS transporter [Pseudomonadota bacterium]
MRALWAQVGALLVAVAILFAGNGLHASLLAVNGSMDGFPLALIGALMSAYFTGFILGCRFAPSIIQTVGHIRTFTALASIASAVALAHALISAPGVWIAFRVVSGFCLAGLVMILESWFNARATSETRGRLLSVYRIVDFGAIALGQALLTLADPRGFTLFALISILISLALVPVALTRSDAPEPTAATRFSLTKVFQTAPLAAYGCFASGLINASVFALGPVFIQKQGFHANEIALFMTAVILGGVAAQWPVGVLSDRIDRRFVIFLVALAGSIAGFALFDPVAMALPHDHAYFFAVIGFFFGMPTFSLFGAALAQGNDRVTDGRFVEMNSGLLMLYGIGAVIGPLIAASTMTSEGPSGLFVFTVVVNLLLLFLSLVRLLFGKRVAQRRRTRILSRSTPVIFQIDAQRSRDE